jgi:hypothetical protein
MRVFKVFADFDKEERWLNRMAADGRLLVGASLWYTFAPVEPGRAVVRIDYRDSMKAADYADYIALFADAGWQHMAGSRHGGPHYFASFAGDADAEIFSDAASLAQRYRRSIGATAAVVTSFLVVVVVLATQGWLQPSQIYLTPGLWEMQGWAFVRSFLFETPFALMRLAPYLLVFACVAGAVQIAYQAFLYRRTVARGSQ